MTQLVSGNTKVGTRYATHSGFVRLQDPASRRYLHLSGKGLVKGETWAWIGSRLQAARLRDRAEATGAPFDFVEVEPGPARWDQPSEGA